MKSSGSSGVASAAAAAVPRATSAPASSGAGVRRAAPQVAPGLRGARTGGPLSEASLTRRVLRTLLG